MDIDLLSPMELREMGEPDPCPCTSTYREYDPQPTGYEIYDVCVDCGATGNITLRVTPW